MEEEKYCLHKALDEHLDSQESKPAERDYFYISEIGKPKNELYEKIKYKKPFKCDARVKRILDNGNAIHEKYAKYFVEMGIMVAAEINAVKNDLLSGRLDFIITDRKQNYIVEIKSCSQWTFNKLTAPTYDHNLQIQFYMYYTNIPRGFMLYENKDNSAIKCYYVELDKELVENKVKELEKLKVNIQTGVPPEEQPTKIEELKYGI